MFVNVTSHVVYSTRYHFVVHVCAVVKKSIQVLILDFSIIYFHTDNCEHCKLQFQIAFVSVIISLALIAAYFHGTETWPVRKENEVALQRAAMRMVR